MSKRVTLTRQINGSDGTFAAGTTLSLDDGIAESLVSQGAAKPDGWVYKGRVGTLPAPATPAPERAVKTETTSRKASTETATTRTGKIEG